MLNRLENWDWKIPSSQYDGVVIDFTKTKFIEPWAVAMFVSHAMRLKAELNLEVTANLDLKNPANKYLSDMGLDQVLSSGRSIDHWEDSQQNTGIHVIHAHDDVTRFANSLANLNLSRHDDTADALKYCVAEIGRNVVQHAKSASGGIAMAQVFPDSETVQITVCDSGIGTLQSLSVNHPELQSDLESLKYAVLPHVSGVFRGGYFASDNAGLGLFFTKEIACRAGGTFILASGTSILYETERSSNTPNRQYRTGKGIKGTSVTVHIPIEAINDFASLLALCRELADKARSSPGRTGIDFLTELPEIEGLEVIDVGDFNEDVGRAGQVRDAQILPAIKGGRMIVLNFAGSRFATQSFVHALLSSVFQEKGSLARLSFINCTSATEEAIRLVAAYSATYKLQV